MPDFNVEVRSLNESKEYVIESATILNAVKRGLEAFAKTHTEPATDVICSAQNADRLEGPQ